MYIYIYIYNIIPLPETFVSKKVSCNLRRNDTLEMRQVHSVYPGAESNMGFSTSRIKIIKEL